MLTWDLSVPLLFFTLATTNLALISALFQGYTIVIERQNDSFHIYLQK